MHIVMNIHCLCVAVVNIGFAESAIVVDEPSTFNVSVVLLENNLDPGTAISLEIRAVDGVASGMQTD